MSEEFKVEIVNPEKSFLVKEDVSEVVVPAFEGEMGILKDHISIISFLKPGIVKILSKSGDDSRGQTCKVFCCIDHDGCVLGGRGGWKCHLPVFSVYPDEAP